MPDIEKLELIIENSIASLKADQSKHYSGRYNNDEIAESNISHHLAAALKRNNFYIAPEFPLSEGRRLDLLSANLNDWEKSDWIAIEIKRYFHSNFSSILDDLQRLENIERTEKELEGCVKCFIGFNRFPDISEWWTSKGKVSLREKNKQPPTASIEKDFLKRNGAIIRSATWHEGETDDRGEKWVYDVLYIIFR